MSYFGATTPTLAITAATAGMTGYPYRCRVTNEVGAAYSDEAELTVNAPTNIEFSHEGSPLTDGQVVNLGSLSGGNFPDLIVDIENTSAIHDATFDATIRNDSPVGAFGLTNDVDPNPVTAMGTANYFANGRAADPGSTPFSSVITFAWTSLAGSGTFTVTFTGVQNNP